VFFVLFKSYFETSGMTGNTVDWNSSRSGTNFVQVWYTSCCIRQCGSIIC